jgi:formylglycine-generating enzyme required for sulfatase activity
VTPAPPPPPPPEGMVYVPGGTFDMGPPQSVTLGKAPQRVTVAAYFLDRTEVTVEAYLACVKAKGCAPSEHQSGCNATAKKPRLQHPMNCISKGQAEQYCLAQGKRLPSAAEWEFAARGTDGRSYPWGNEAAGDQVCWQARAGGLNEETCPVGSFPAGASPFGALDMAGNVAEWTSTEVTESAAPGGFFTRGGSYRFDPIDLADVERLHIRTDESEPFAGYNAIPTIGVRCAKNL